MACLSDFFPDAVVLVNEYMDILKADFVCPAVNAVGHVTAHV